MKHRYNILWLLLLMLAMVGCRRGVELSDAPRQLEPIDLILRIEGYGGGAPDHQDPFLAARNDREVVVDEDKSLGITVTRRVSTRSNTPEIDELIKDLNIFMFYKDDAPKSGRDSIVRHYYISNTNPTQAKDIRLSNLYVGNYDLYVVANNGSSLCVNHDHDSGFGCQRKLVDMSTLKSSTIPQNSFVYYNLMSFDSTFQVKRSEQVFSFSLRRLTSKIDLTLTNNWNMSRAEAGRDGYITLNNYSVMNLPITARLFGPNTPQQGIDIDHRIGVALTKVNTESEQIQVVMLNNMQGDIPAATVPSYRDRNMTYAPPSATYLSLSATYVINMLDTKNISYHLYLGGPGKMYNNFDVINGLHYTYSINFNKPDLTDPRVTSLSVLKEKTLFVDSKGGNTNFKVGTVISRSLEVQCSRLADGELMISCENVTNAAPKDYLYSIYVEDPAGGLTLVKSGFGDAVKGVALPVTSREANGLATVKIKIEYLQNDPSTQFLALTLKTKEGMQYQVKPYGPTGSTNQQVTYYP